MTVDTGRLAVIKETVRAAQGLVLALDAASSREDLQAAHATLLKGAMLVRGLIDPAATGCSIHPAGPVDPDPPPLWGHCLLCNVRRRRSRLAKRTRNDDADDGDEPG